MTPGVDFTGFVGLQADSVPAFPAFKISLLKYRPGCKGSASPRHGPVRSWDEQPEPGLLMGEDMFDMGPGRGFGSFGPRG